MGNQIINVPQAEMLSAINRSEIDTQIATAKRYPRNTQQALSRIQELATIDEETAFDCFYIIKRGDKHIEGLSVRFAEVVAGAWGNLRAQARIIGNDGRTITAQGVCHDLETNFAVSVEVKRRITDKNGATYSEDMQVITGNAACAVAFRNAVLKVVPETVTKSIIDNIKRVAAKRIEEEIDKQGVANEVKRAVEYFEKRGVNLQALLAYLGVKRIKDVDHNKIIELRGLLTAINEGTTTIAETFNAHTADSENIAKEARKAAEEKQRKIAEAFAQATGGSVQVQEAVLFNDGEANK